jgi:hypothetical protein
MLLNQSNVRRTGSVTSVSSTRSHLAFKFLVTSLFVSPQAVVVLRCDIFNSALLAGTGRWGSDINGFSVSGPLRRIPRHTRRCRPQKVSSVPRCRRETPGTAAEMGRDDAPSFLATFVTLFPTCSQLHPALFASDAFVLARGI